MVKDRLYGNTKSGITVVAMVALLFRCRSGILRLAVRASGLASPPDFFQVADAVRFGREKLVNSDDVHGHYLLLGHNLAQKIAFVKRNLLP